jgi:hypothetical protein
VKEGLFSLSIHKEESSEEFAIFLHSPHPFGVLQVKYQCAVQGQEITGEKVLILTQAEPQYHLGKISLINVSKPSLVSLMMFIESLAKA